jgi:predicted ATPase with chaperone activity
MVEPDTLIATLLGDKGFQPLEAQTLEQAGLSESLVDSLICKHLNVLGNATGRSLAESICLPLRVVELRFGKLKSRHWLTHMGSAPLNDYVYALTDQGRGQAQLFTENCAYLGPAPVPLSDYITSVDAQTIAARVPQRHLREAFSDVSVGASLLARLGPAVNSGAGLFLYGAPGNGKTTLAERITLCFGQEIWLPQVLLADGEIIKLYDPAYHREVSASPTKLLRQDCLDQRWIKISRPTVIVGGELTMDCLEIRHDPRTNVSEAPLQMKSNCGSLFIDDFGRQRIDPMQLLNRWIVPLEKRYDFLTLASGKKIQVPFDLLVVFSTNLEPKDLVDEAFLRRIPYKIHVPDPDEAEFHKLFQLCAPIVGCDYDPEAVEYLLESHYRRARRPLRRCHPRDLLLQIRNYCAYVGLPVVMKPEYFDVAVENYFTVMG